MSAPLCRWCGRRIRKSTITVEFGRDKPSSWSWQVHRPERPKTLDEAKRLVNGRVLSHKMATRGEHAGTVESMRTWDGESYVDPAFDTDRCAATFGRAMAEHFPTWGGPAWIEATKGDA